MREVHIMPTLQPRGARRLSFALLALVVVLSASSSAFLPSTSRTALAADGVAMGDAVILAGPGGQYGILTVAPAGAAMSVDGDPVDGYYPVTFEGISGWTAVGLLQVNGGRSAENGNGGVETVSADPTFSDTGEPVAPAPEAANAEPVNGGTYGPGGASYSEEQIVDIINEAASNYGQSSDDMLRVARCESGLNPGAVGGGGAYHGLFQFVPSTFAQTPYGEYDIYDPWANANAAAWKWSEGGKGEWVCQ
jgi:uncharacterized protein YraI